METPNNRKQDLEKGELDAANEKGLVQVTLDVDLPQTAEPLPPDDTCATQIQAIDCKRNSTNSGNGDEADDSYPSYPKAFYCPITKKIMEDPVAVAPEGISYERVALGDDIPANMLYGNRAVKSIIDETVEYKANSGLKRLQQSVRQLITGPGFQRPLPEGYYCPITLSLIHVPVLDPEGYTYEKVAIENWIRYNGASPVTRRVLSVEELIPNRTLEALMDEEARKSEDLMHPLFKQWKEEPIPEMIGGAAGDAQDGSANGFTVPTRAFPTTPEELEEANRRRRIRSFARCHIWTIVAILLAMLAWMVPVFSTIMLVLILVGIAIVTARSTSTA